MITPFRNSISNNRREMAVSMPSLPVFLSAIIILISALPFAHKATLCQAARRHKLPCEKYIFDTTSFPLLLSTVHNYDIYLCNYPIPLWFRLIKADKTGKKNLTVIFAAVAKNCQTIYHLLCLFLCRNFRKHFIFFYCNLFERANIFYIINDSIFRL